MNNNEYFVNHKHQLCVNIPTQLSAIIKIMDLKPFYEPYCEGREQIGVKPLLQGHTVKSGDREYRAERVFDNWLQPNQKHCYVFIDISINQNQHKNPFAKSPSTVVELLKIKKIVITNFPY